MNKKKITYCIPELNDDDNGTPSAATVCPEKGVGDRIRSTRKIMRRYKVSEQEAQHMILILKEEVLFLSDLFKKAEVDFSDDDHLIDVSFVMDQRSTGAGDFPA